MSADTCRGCGAKVIHALDDKGTRIILDARRHPIYRLGMASVGEERWFRVKEDRISHFVTCPNRTDFSKSRRKTLKPEEQTDGR